MSSSVLVAYATRYGSTHEVAEQVAATLREDGFEVDLQPARQVETVDEYRAVVLGVPLYIGRWLKDAQRFLTQHQEALQERPVAVFSLGPTREGEEEWEAVRGQLDEQLAEFPWLEPVVVALFGGRYDPAKLGLFHRMLASLPASPLYQMPASDVRDWERIEAWATDLAATLQERG
jgi:menaquinone-dependent protoporphyrinogen oxidase